MINNSDIFDEEDLLAIANDEGSSSCGSSDRNLCEENSSDADDGSHSLPLLTSPDITSFPKVQPEAAIGSLGISFNNKQDQVAEFSDGVARREHLLCGGEHHSRFKDGDANNNSSSGDSEDDGFLDSWHETEKKISGKIKEAGRESPIEESESESDEHKCNVKSDVEALGEERCSSESTKNDKTAAESQTDIVSSGDESDDDGFGFLDSWSKSAAENEKVSLALEDSHADGKGGSKEGETRGEVIAETNNLKDLESGVKDVPNVDYDRDACDNDLIEDHILKRTHEDNTPNITDSDTCLHHKIDIELGASINTWISDYQLVKGNQVKRGKARENSSRRENERGLHCANYGVVGIQHDTLRPDFHSDLSNDGIESNISHRPRLLRVSAPPGKSNQKMLRSGLDTSVATLEEVEADDEELKCESKCQCQAAFAPNVERSAAGTMVDCLARYDPEKECYVLEIVQLSVSNQYPSTESAKSLTDATNSCKNPTRRSLDNGDITRYGAVTETLDSVAQQVFLDPRSTARRAENQIRQLKCGKGRMNSNDTAKKRQRKGKSVLGIGTKSTEGGTTVDDGFAVSQQPKRKSSSDRNVGNGNRKRDNKDKKK